MSRWQRSKELDENADFKRGNDSTRAVYKALISYLNRCQLPWKYVEAHLNFIEPEPHYNEIIIDGVIHYADQQLLNDCDDIMMHHNAYTFSDRAMAIIDMEIERDEPLGSFGYSISYLEQC